MGGDKIIAFTFTAIVGFVVRTKKQLWETALRRILVLNTCVNL